MALNAAKLRLGAPSSMILTFTDTTVLDLGASDGGVELEYNSNYFHIEIDQSTLPVAAYRTKEEIMFSVALPQYQINLINTAFAYPDTNVTTVVGTPNTDTIYIGGSLAVTFATLDVTIPKNDGTSNNLLIHMNKVYSTKAFKIGYSRTKNTVLDKLSFIGMADLTQPVGQQLGWLRESY